MGVEVSWIRLQESCISSGRISTVNKRATFRLLWTGNTFTTTWNKLVNLSPSSVCHHLSTLVTRLDKYLSLIMAAYMYRHTLNTFWVTYGVMKWWIVTLTKYTYICVSKHNFAYTTNFRNNLPYEVIIYIPKYIKIWKKRWTTADLIIVINYSNSRKVYFAPVWSKTWFIQLKDTFGWIGYSCCCLAKVLLNMRHTSSVKFMEDQISANHTKYLWSQWYNFVSLATRTSHYMQNYAQ